MCRALVTAGLKMKSAGATVQLSKVVCN